MTVDYSGITITYKEDTNTWDFELRGRARSVRSLAEAKTAIDKVPAEKKKPFPRQKAFRKQYSGIIEVEVTSFAGWESWREPKVAEFWYVDKEGRRSKSSLYAYSKKNCELFRQIQELEAQAKEIDKQIGKLTNSFERFEVPEGVDTEN